MAESAKTTSIDDPGKEGVKVHPAPEGTRVLVTGPEGLTMETEVDENGETGTIPAEFSPSTIQVLVEDED